MRTGAPKAVRFIFPFLFVIGSAALLLVGCTGGTSDTGRPTDSASSSPAASSAQEPLAPEYAWVEQIEEPELRAVVERICRAPRPKEREIPGPKGPGAVKVDEYHPRGDEVATPERGGILVQRINDEPRALNRWTTSSAIASEIDGHVYEALIDIDYESWDYYPLLAERYSVDDYVLLPDGTRHVGRLEDADGDRVVLVDLDGKKHSWEKGDVEKALRGCAFSFGLRKGVKFHNGDVLDADDVLFSWKWMVTPEIPIPHIQGYFTDLEHFDKLDQHTVRAFWGKPYWSALEFIGGAAVIFPRRAWDPDGLIDKDPQQFGETVLTHKLASEPIGTGPYKFKEWRRGTVIKLERFDGYHWPEHEPRYLDELHFRPVVDPVAAIQALEAGEVDYIDRVQAAEVFRDFRQKTEASGKFVYVETLYPVYFFIGWNLRKPMFQDRRVRWALSLGAIDMDRYLDELYDGTSLRATQPEFIYGRAAHPGLPPIPFDPDAARELLAAAGWWDSDGDNVLDRDGKAFAFEFLLRTVPATHPYMQLAERMKENLKALGIRMDIRVLDWPTLLETLDKRDFDAIHMGLAYGTPPHEIDPFQLWHSSAARERGSNFGSYSNEETDRLIERSREETDWERRKPLKHQIAEHIYMDQPVLFLNTPTMFRLYNAKFRGVKMYLPRPGYWIDEWFIAQDS